MGGWATAGHQSMQYAVAIFPHNTKGCMPAMRKPVGRRDSSRMSRRNRADVWLEVPALCFRDEKVAEHLHPRHRFELFRIDEIGIEGDGVGLAEQLHESAILLDQVIRQQGNADSPLACA